MTYPLTFPENCVSMVVMSMQFVNSESQSPFTLEQQFYPWGAQQWVVDMTNTPVKDYTTAQDFIAFMLKLRGKYGTFLLGDPSYTTAQGAWSGTPVVDGSGQFGSTLLIRGASINITNYAVRGDYIQIGTGLNARLYKVLENANSDGSGDVSLTVAPDVRPNTADGAAIITTNPKGLFRSSSNEPSWSYDTDKIFRFAFSAVEAI